MKHYKSSSNCYKDFIPVKGVNKCIRDMREDFEDLFTAEHDYRQKRGDKSVVFCLTYNDEHIRNFYGHNVLDSDDVHKCISKASKFGKKMQRAGYTFDYVLVGEYGNGGVTHGVHGVRGSGNNPHYHGVGWFHKFDTSKPTLPYDTLCSMLREAWQGCAESNPSVYGRSRAMRAAGLGFVCLSGEILCPTAGVQYISKYIGKDIMTLHKDMLSEVLPGAFKQVAYAVIIEFFNNRDLGDMSVVSQFYQHWQMFLPFNHPLYLPRTRDTWFTPSNMYYKYVPFVNDILDSFYHDFMEDFCADVNRISPKLRHFHGFGHSLLAHADLETGTYARPFSSGRRSLPLCLIRKAYYNYSVSLVPNEDVRRTSRFYNVLGDKTEIVKKYAKQVSYTLNELGRKRLVCSLEKRINVGILAVRSLHLDVSPLAVAVVHTFLHTQLTDEVHTVLFNILDSNEPDTVTIPALRDTYLSIVNCTAPDWYRELNPEPLYSFDRMLTDFPKLRTECFVYVDFLTQNHIELENKATEFVGASFKIYKSTY